MTRFKRRVLFGSGLVALVVLGVAGWLYYNIFMASGFALRHAEAFLFRRMTVAQLSEEGSYRYFYMTNRRQEPGDAPTEERFGKDRDEVLKFGSFDTVIKPTLGLGMLINPTEWFQNEEITIQDVREFDLCVAVTNWSTEAAGIAQLRRSKTLPPVAFDPFGDGRWEDVHRGALSTRAAGVPC